MGIASPWTSRNSSRDTTVNFPSGRMWSTSTSPLDCRRKVGFEISATPRRSNCGPARYQTHSSPYRGTWIPFGDDMMRNLPSNTLYLCSRPQVSLIIFRNHGRLTSHGWLSIHIHCNYDVGRLSFILFFNRGDVSQGEMWKIYLCDGIP